MADGKVIFKYIGDTSDLDRSNAEAEGKFSKFSAAAGKALLAIGTAAVAAGAAIVKVGTDFESAFAGVIKTVDATDAELATLRAGVLDMSKELPASAIEIAGVAEAAGQLGIETDNILGFTRAMIDLGESTNLTAEQAATELARFANITGMSQADFDRLGSTIVYLGNNFATTEAEIVSMGMRLAGAAKQAGMSEPDIMAMAAALSSVGIEAEAGGTAFSKVITDINIAVQTGNADLRKFASVAGMTADEFKQAFEENAAGAVVAFVTGLGNMEESGGSAILTLEELEITEIRMRDALLRASGASDLLTKAIEGGSAAFAENTALTVEAEQRYSTLESRWDMLKNQASVLGVELYDELRPSLVGVIDAAEEMFETLRQEGVVETLGKSIGDLGKTLGDALIAILPVLIELIEDVVPIFSEIGDALVPVMKDSFEKLLPPLLDLVKAILPPLLSIIEAIVPLISMTSDLLGPLISQLSGPLTVALGLVADALSIIVGLIGLIVEAIKWILGKGGDFDTYLNMLKNPFTGSGATVQAVSGVMDATAQKSNNVNQSSSMTDKMAAAGIIKAGGARARGDAHWRGGRVLVGEEGPEIVDLPAGARIYPADVSSRMLSSAPNTSSLTSTQTIGTINVYPDSKEYGRILSMLEQADRARQVGRAGGRGDG